MWGDGLFQDRRGCSTIDCQRPGFMTMLFRGTRMQIVGMRSST